MVRESTVTYFCFVESDILGVPHMEPLDADGPESALAEARVLIGRHASATAAHIFFGEDRIGTVTPDAAG